MSISIQRERSVVRIVTQNSHVSCIQCRLGKVKVKVWTLVIAPLMSQTSDQQRFTISEVAADGHEPNVGNGAAAHYVVIHCPR